MLSRRLSEAIAGIALLLTAVLVSGCIFNETPPQGTPIPSIIPSFDPKQCWSIKTMPNVSCNPNGGCGGQIVEKCSCFDGEKRVDVACSAISPTPCAVTNEKAGVCEVK